MVLKDGQGKEIKLGSKVVFLRGEGYRSKKKVMTIGKITRIRTEELLRLDGTTEDAKVHLEVTYTMVEPKRPQYDWKTRQHVEFPGETEEYKYSRSVRNAERVVVLD